VTNLAAIGQLNLLHRLFGRVDIAQAVWDELNANDRSWPGRDEVARASWIVRQTPSNGALIRALQRDLDRGNPRALRSRSSWGPI
jgi:predicted nucleic acid-binding protein